MYGDFIIPRKRNNIHNFFSFALDLFFIMLMRDKINKINEIVIIIKIIIPDGNLKKNIGS